MLHQSSAPAVVQTQYIASLSLPAPLKMQYFIFLLCFICLSSYPVQAQKKKEITTQPDTAQSLLDGLKFRNIGPAITSGRIADFAVHPKDRKQYFVATASGGVWKTVNAGATFEPLFDSEGSYSIGCITLDPKDPNVVWVGTGENNNQRSVSYGDGVYRSADGGKSWKNMGLKNSEHIAKIIVHPDNSNVIYVAAYGPLWSSGGERGVYKSTDAGATWKPVLTISEQTGIADMVMDPRNPDLLYAAAHQRRRHVFTYISGGPESVIYKTTDGGENWQKINEGLPKKELGRIGLAISPANPDYLYAIVEAAGEEGGFYRSLNGGAQWEKRGSYSTSGNYYQEIVCDPKDVNRVYSMDTYMMVTDDGGKSFTKLGEEYKHVDNHALWIDPDDTDYYLAGCDGGIYESYDQGKSWDFKENLPITQFYKIATDNDEPFYYVYGGTQDNSTLGGPSRTINKAGIVNSDWFVPVGGDGFQPQVDPQDPNTVYAQWQYGNLVRYDRRSGERIDIKPRERADEAAYRWNWDAPLMISPHSHTRLYFAANKLFRSNDRGNRWEVISDDLTRQLNRNELPVMGKVWSIDAVAKNESTSKFGNIVALTESPLQEGLLYAGTDDGLVQVSEDGGKSWTKYSTFPGVPDMTYVNALVASQHDANTVYAAFNNHKRGDFKPYILKSTNRGKSWTSLENNLPKRGSVYTLAEDPVEATLLFAGTEYGVFYSNNGGQQWKPLKSGLPTIAVRDIRIQKRENDLVLATFGRGFYILDDYSALRTLPDALAKDAHIFPVRDAQVYIERNPYGYGVKGFLGASFYAASNPEVGATFTYYLKKDIKTHKESRQETETKASDEELPLQYPTYDSLVEEVNEDKPSLLFTITDAKGKVVKRLTAPPKKGVHRITWNLRYPPTTPVSLKKEEEDAFSSGDLGVLTMPGTYAVSMAKYVNGKVTPLAGPVTFQTKALKNNTLPAENRDEIMAFRQKVAELQRVTSGTVKSVSNLDEKLKLMKEAVTQTPAAPVAWMDSLRSIQNQLGRLKNQLTGDALADKLDQDKPPAIVDRVSSIVYGAISSTAAPTQTQQQAYSIASEAFSQALTTLKQISQGVATMEQKLEEAGAPYTPGRTIEWTKQ